MINRRLHDAVFGYPRFCINFSCVAQKMNQFNLICSHLSTISSKIVSLKFSDNNISMIHIKIDRFFQFIGVHDIFSSLHSIIFSQIDSNVWNSIRTRLTLFVSLKSISIHLISGKELTPLVFNDLVLNVPSLKRLNFRSSCPWPRTVAIPSIHSPRRVTSIQYLTLKGVRIDLDYLFDIMPMLCQIDIELWEGNFSSAIQSPISLQRLSIVAHHMTITEIELLLSGMNYLTYFTVFTDGVNSDWVDGNTWAGLVSKIARFKFSFCI